MNYWLLKSEPTVYSLTDLQRERVTLWEGIRNYQARNFLRQMQEGDTAFFYHSNTNPPGIAGLMRVVTPNVVDPTQFELQSQYYDPKSTAQSPRWQTVVVEFVDAFSHFVTLEALKQEFTAQELAVVKQGNRLSVMPVPQTVAQRILAMAKGTKE